MGILKIQMVFSISHQSLKWGQKRNPKVLYLKVFVEQIHHIKTVRSEKRKKLLKSENLTNRLLQENHSKAIIIYHTITFVNWILIISITIQVITKKVISWSGQINWKRCQKKKTFKWTSPPHLRHHHHALLLIY